MTVAKTSPATGVGTIFLHVGLMKTGTTYLQSRLKEHRADLSANGVVVPRGQLHAVRDRFGRRGTLNKRDVDRAWDTLLHTLRTTPGRAGVVSMEFLSTAPAATAREIVAELAPADVHVVVTVRDLSRVLAAQWQESIQNRASWTWEEYSDAAVSQLAAGLSPSTAPRAGAPHSEPGHELDEDPRSARGGRSPGEKFWRQQDAVRVVADWAAAVGSDHVHIVTVPGPGSSPDVLWHRFGRVIGVDPERHQRSEEPIRVNLGLDLGAAEFLRRLNSRLQSNLAEADIPKSAYIRTVKHVLGKRALVGGEVASKPQLTPGQHAAVLLHTRQLIDHLTSLGVEVAGDLADLIPARPSSTGTADGAELDRHVADVAIEAVLAMIRHVEGLGPVPAAKGKRRRNRRAALSSTGAIAPPARAPGADDADEEW